MNTNYKIGQTKVKVYQTDERGQTSMVHHGIVIGVNSSFLRVFNPDSVDRGGDVSPQVAQWFAINSPRCRCELNGETKVAIKLPADI